MKTIRVRAKTLFMVEQLWRFGDQVTTIRSMVAAHSKKKALGAAPDAIRAMIRDVAGCVIGKPASAPTVAYGLH